MGFVDIVADAVAMVVRLNYRVSQRRVSRASAHTYQISWSADKLTPLCVTTRRALLAGTCSHSRLVFPLYSSGEENVSLG